MGESVKKENRTRLYPCAAVLYFLILLAIHSRIVTGTGDDAWFAAVLDRYDLLSYLQVRYSTWTSRLPAEALLIYLSRWPSWIWKGLNICVLMLLVCELSEIWGDDEDRPLKTRLFFAVFLFLLPVQMHNGAGWITTTMNYLWPITFGLSALIPLRRWENGRFIRPYEFLLYAVGCFLGCFQEQTAAVLFTVFILYAIRRRIQRQIIPVFLYVLCAIAFIVLVFTLTCPGNAARSISETETWLPEFVSFTLADKLLTGFLRTCSFYISCESGNSYFLLLVSALFALMLIERRSVFLCLAGAYSWLITFVCGFCGTVCDKLGIAFQLPLMNLIRNTELPRINASITFPDVVAENLLFISILACVAGLLYSAFGNDRKEFVCGDNSLRLKWAEKFCMLFILVSAALCSGFIMGFSPTVYASGGRVFLQGSLILLGILYVCVRKLMKSIAERRETVMLQARNNYEKSID